MIFPTIHSNGTSAKELEKNNMKALEGIAVALEAIHDAAPNGRDYYPQGPEAIQTAIKEFSQHAQALHAAREYFEAQVIIIQSASIPQGA